jgi:hypothetical protein
VAQHPGTTKRTIAAQPSAPAASRIKRARFWRDALIMLIGIPCAIIGQSVPHPALRATRANPGLPLLTELGIWLAIGFFILTLVHLARPYQPRQLRNRWFLSLAGLLLAAYCLLGAGLAAGIVGAKATGTAENCAPLDDATYLPGWQECDVTVHWSVGSTEVVPNVQLQLDSATATMVKPSFSAWPFSGNIHRYNGPDALAILIVGALLGGQAIFSLGVLIFSRPQRSATG